MGDHSAIEWTDTTWNPVVGCTRVSAGCDNCYAARFAATRGKHTPTYKDLAVITDSGRAAFNGKIRLLPDRLEDPLRWQRARRVFVNSMSDLFHEDVPDEYIARVFGVMARAPQHTFQILTKRPARMQTWAGDPDAAFRTWMAMVAMAAPREDGLRQPPWPLPNVWLGVSIEHQATADERIPLLLETPAAVRFVSAEPLLGAIDFTRLRPPGVTWLDCLGGRQHVGLGVFGALRLDWVIVGGESGVGARPMNITWVRNIITQCEAAGVPAFVKQLGAKPYLHVERSVTHRSAAGTRVRMEMIEFESSIHLRDLKGGDPAEWPVDLRVREFPTPAVPA